MKIPAIITTMLFLVGIVALRLWFEPSVTEDATSDSPNLASSPTHSHAVTYESRADDVIDLDSRLDGWHGDSMFSSADPALVDDSAIQKMIAGANLRRYRLVKVNENEIRQYFREPLAGGELKLQLFEDKVVSGVPDKVVEYTEGRRAGFGSWRGMTTDDIPSSISVVLAPDGSASINVNGPVGTFIVSQIDQTSIHIIMDLMPSDGIYADDMITPASTE